MPYTVQWLVPNKIIEAVFDGVLTTDEFYEYDRIVAKMLDLGEPNQVHFLTDVRHLQQFPNLSQARQMQTLQHPNFGWAVLVGNTNPIFKAIGILLGTLFGNRIQWFSTREDALAFFQRLDNTLSELK